MKPPDPRDIAIREGIGSRLLELGFTRKSKRLYVQEDDAYIRRVFFSHYGDGSFGDVAMVVSKELQALVEQLAVPDNQYNFRQSVQGHVWYSAALAWKEDSQQSEAVWRRKLGWLGPIAWILPWRERWRRHDPYEQCPYVVGDTWRPENDPEACAAASLSVWRHRVEPWLTAMNDPPAFARWYQNRDWASTHLKMWAIAWFWAGNAKRAQGFLQDLFDQRLYDLETARKDLRERPRVANAKRSSAEIEETARLLVATAQRSSREALRIAQALGLTLQDETDHL